MAIGKRIKEKREELDISQVELAQKIGCTKQTLYKYENDIVTNIPSTSIEKLAKALKTSPSYLMGWEENSSLSRSGIDLSKISNLMPLPYTSGRTVPLIGTIACGTPILAEENVEDEIALPDSVSADFCLRCKGDSMIDAGIYDGSIVFIREQPIVENGEIAAVLIDEMVVFSEATLKRVYLYPDRIMLSAENKSYQPLIYVAEEMNNVRIVGKAVAVLNSVK